MQNRVVTLETTKAYGEAFNNRDLAAIADLLDDQNVIFSRQEQSTIIGKENVLRRIKTLFQRTDERNRKLELISAIIDLGNSKARPCLLCLMNGIPVAVCVISCKINGKINAIAILLNGAVVSTARPTEKKYSDKGQLPAEPSRKAVLALTKAYITAFNKRDLNGLSDMLDESQSVFTRTDQEAIVGRDAILDRVRDLYRRLDSYGQDLTVVNGIIDHKERKAWPCSIGVLDGSVISIAMLSATPTNCISEINVILTPAIVEKARPTEPLPEPKKEHPDAAVLKEREAWLLDRAKKIERIMKRDGRLPHLITKQIRVEQQLEKIAFLKRKLGIKT
ncbi:MAG: hypothetical protein ACNI26_03495 [Terasakiella sp.]|uniref:hypothetical protein n=1 Tax=unclassified Terasakiella TaxID=2614952 RepID=UPI003B0041DF